MKILSTSDFGRIIAAAMAVAFRHGHSYYGWRDEPVVELDRETADVIWKEKLNGAYGERLLASLGLLAAVVAHKYPVRFVQFKAEKGMSFDAAGWTAVAVGGARGWWTILHLAPWDFDPATLGDIVEVVEENNSANGFIPWADLRPTKPAEYAALLRAAQLPGLDMIEEIGRLSREGELK